jgi:hypothetical protein
MRGAAHVLTRARSYMRRMKELSKRKAAALEDE